MFYQFNNPAQLETGRECSGFNTEQAAAEQAAAEQLACPLHLPLGDIYSAETQYSVRMMDKPVCCILLCVKCYLHIRFLSICPMTPFDKQKVKSNKQKRTEKSKHYKKKPIPKSKQDKQKGKVKSTQKGKTKKVNMIKHPVS